jgi:hypothetical protein
VIAKSHFRNGGANLPVCREVRQNLAHLSEMTFGSRKFSIEYYPEQFAQIS